MIMVNGKSWYADPQKCETGIAKVTKVSPKAACNWKCYCGKFAWKGKTAEADEMRADY